MSFQSPDTCGLTALDVAKEGLGVLPSPASERGKRACRLMKGAWDRARLHVFYLAESPGEWASK